MVRKYAQNMGTNTLYSSVLNILLGASLGACAQAAPAKNLSAELSQIELPGNGLAQHDFLYAGEAFDRRIYIVRHGKIVWIYDDPAGKGEISDAVMLSSGNILFAHQYGVTEITQDKKVVWNFDAPAGHEIHTAVPIGKDRVLFIENGSPTALLKVVNIVTGATERETKLAVKQPVTGVHGQFRHARLTERGTLFVAHMDLNKVIEYDGSGNELWSFPAESPWGVTPLPNGNVLITDKVGVREVTRRGDSVWTLVPSDVPEYHFAAGDAQQAWRLPNGNTLLNKWANQWGRDGRKNSEAGREFVQAIEVTPKKEVVWALKAWKAPADLGPATTIQVLDETVAPEAVHFGDIY